MTLDEFAYAKDDFKPEVKKAYLQTFFNHLIDHAETDCSELVDEILTTATAYEADDYFGTEGFKFR